MSDSLTPLNFSAVALNVLQSRGNAAIDAVSSALESEQQVAVLLRQESEQLAKLTQSGTGPIPRGQLLNILI